jgi:hypothetical protein
LTVLGDGRGHDKAGAWREAVAMVEQDKRPSAAHGLQVERV